MDNQTTKEQKASICKKIEFIEQNINIFQSNKISRLDVDEEWHLKTRHLL